MAEEKDKVEEQLPAEEGPVSIEIEIEKVDYASLAYYVASVITMIPEIDVKQMTPSEEARILKVKSQSLKLLCFAMNKLTKEHFPKTKVSEE